MKNKQILSIALSGLFIIFLIVIYGVVLNKYHIPDSINTTQIDITSIQPGDWNDSRFISTTFDTLYYTGYDYYRDGAKAGAYYYYIIPDTTTMHQLSKRYLLVLVKDQSGTATLTNYTCNCKISDQDGSLENIASRLANDTSISYMDIESMFQSYLLNEADYPSIQLGITKIFLVASILAILLYLFLWIQDFIKYCKSHNKKSE